MDNDGRERTREMDLDDLMASRSSIYRAIAGVFSSPLTLRQLEGLAGMDLTTLAPDDEGARAGLEAMQRSLTHVDDNLREQLAVDFTSAFLGTHTYRGRTALPFESMHTGGAQRYMGPARTRVYNIYKHLCVKLENGAGLPEDHLCYECDFVAVMSDRTSDALGEARVHDAVRALMVQQAFIERHMLSWFDAFESVACDVLHSPFYKGVLTATKAYLNYDRDVLASLIAELCASSGIDPSAVAIDMDMLEKSGPYSLDGVGDEKDSEVI